jgi:hypothetical protein
MLLVFYLDLSLEELERFVVISLPFSITDFSRVTAELEDVKGGRDDDMRDPKPDCSVRRH